MKTFVRFFVLAVVALLALPAWAGPFQVFKIYDLEETGIRVYFNDILVTPSGGGGGTNFQNITNWNLPIDNETVTFTYDTGLPFTGTTGVYYTPILENGVQAWSDVFKITATQGASTLNVAFYSDGSATFPTNQDMSEWIRLSRRTGQGLPDPFWEDGTYQLVGTYFNTTLAAPGGGFAALAPPTPNTEFYMQSDIEPEPATLSMFLGAGLLLAGLGIRKARR